MAVQTPLVVQDPPWPDPLLLEKYHTLVVQTPVAAQDSIYWPGQHILARPTFTREIPYFGCPDPLGGPGPPLAGPTFTLEIPYFGGPDPLGGEAGVTVTCGRTVGVF